MEAVIVIVVIVLLIGGAIGWGLYADKKRKEALEVIATEMGLDFLPDGSTELHNQLSGFKLLNSGRAKKLTKLIRGQSDEVMISIFDYQYTTGSGKHSKTHYQTVAALQSPRLGIPDFTMRPENMFDKLGGMIGLQDIDFDTHPMYSKMFVLKGSNETAIRQTFKPPILEFFQNKKGISVEGDRGTIIIYRPGRFVKPDQIKDFLGEAYEVFGVFADNA